MIQCLPVPLICDFSVHTLPDFSVCSVPSSPLLWHGHVRGFLLNKCTFLFSGDLSYMYSLNTICLFYHFVVKEQLVIC